MKKLFLSLAVGAMSLMTFVPLGGPPVDAAYNNYEYSFRGCSWRLRIEDSNIAVGTATAKTYDLNQGCHRLDADVKYKVSGSQTVQTKYCASEVTDYKICQQGKVNNWPVVLYGGHGSAQDSESQYYWQHSGWKTW